MRKPHAGSVLKTLPPERQAAIFQFMGGHTLAETEAWLHDDGIVTQRSSLSEFWQWYPTASIMHSAANITDTVREILAELPQLQDSGEQISEVAQNVFEAMAIQMKDSALHLGLRRLRQNDQALRLKAEGDAKKLPRVSIEAYNGEPIETVLDDFGTWIAQTCRHEDVRPFGNSASFDLGILGGAYDRLGKPRPWVHWNERCFRTIRNLYPAVEYNVEDKGREAHNALADAVFQASHIFKIKQSRSKKNG